MANNAPGKHFRKGISLMALMEMFPNDETAEEWFTTVRWDDGEPVCPFCGSERAALIPNRKPMPYRCKDCRRHFSVKHGTVMQSSKLGCRVWAIAVYLLTTGIKGTSSMKLHRDVAVTYKTAWHLAHRIRKAFPGVVEQFAGPVEADETAIGGVEKNKHGSKKRRQGRGSVGKAIVHGVLDRATNQVVAGVVDSTDAATLQGLVLDATIPSAHVYTDEATAYAEMPRRHDTVQHSTGEYVRDQAHTNGIELVSEASAPLSAAKWFNAKRNNNWMRYDLRLSETLLTPISSWTNEVKAFGTTSETSSIESFWAMLDRGIMGSFHHVSPKHLDRYIGEFAGRHNQRSQDTMQQMQRVAGGMVGKRLRYTDLIGPESTRNPEMTV